MTGASPDPSRAGETAVTTLSAGVDRPRRTTGACRVGVSIPHDSTETGAIPNGVRGLGGDGLEADTVDVGRTVEE